MKRYLYLVIVLTGVLCATAQSLQPGVDYVPGQVIFKLTQRVTLYQEDGVVKTGIADIDSLASMYKQIALDTFFYITPKTDLTLYNSLGMDRIYFASFPETTDVISLIQIYKDISFVEWAEPNYISFPLSVPNDTQYYKQWSLDNNANQPPEYPDYYGTVGADIDAERAWEFNTEDSSVSVAVIDAGVSYKHPDLQSKIWHNMVEVNGYLYVDDDNNNRMDDTIGWDFYDGDATPQESTTAGAPSAIGHGTPIAGIVGAAASNTIGVAGICPSCKIMPLRVGSTVFFDSLIALAIYYATLKDASVINMSFARGTINTAVQTAINYAYGNGVVLVAGMGNDDQEITYWPAAFYNVLAVGATETHDLRVNMTLTANWPPWGEPQPWGSNFGNHIDVVAPGLSLWTTGCAYNYHGQFIYDRYWYFSWTSGATPIVSGIAALLLASTTRPDINNDSIYKVIRYSAEDQVGNPSEDTPGWDKYHGYGRVNAYQALYALKRGDVNNDRLITAVDVTWLVNYIFNKPGGPWDPLPYKGTDDCNCNHSITIGDIVYLGNYVYSGGPPPLICFYYNY